MRKRIRKMKELAIERAFGTAKPKKKVEAKVEADDE